MDPITAALVQEFTKQHELGNLAPDKQFEHFAAYSIISSRYDEEFSTDDVVLGAGGDLGIDACAIIANGRLITEEEEVADIVAMSGFLDVEFVFVQGKRSPKFDGGSILKFCENLRNGIFLNDTSLPRNENASKISAIVQEIYKNAAKLRHNPDLRIYYASTGYWSEDDYLKSIISAQIKQYEQTSLFSSTRFIPVGAQQLQDLYRQTNKSITRSVVWDKNLTLPNIDRVKASYLGAMKASEYIKLITDEDGSIIKSIFVDNVRDFQGTNPVNRGISATISDGFLDQFVLRNNGITIVARDVRITGPSYTIQDYQIVNGCQTSYVLFENIEQLSDELLVPVKLVYTEDEEVTQEIIKSTNRQTPIEENDLLALTRFQRDLESYYSSHAADRQLYYERRSKQYADRPEVEKTRIVPIGLQLKFFAAMFLSSAHQAGRYQATLLKNVGDQVFRPEHRPEPYYTSALAFYKFEGMLRRGVGHSDLRSFKFHFLSAFRHRFEPFDLPSFSHKTMADYCNSLNARLWDGDLAREAFDTVADIIRRAAANRSLSLDRDSAKVRDLSDEIKRIASDENDVRKAGVAAANS